MVAQIEVIFIVGMHHENVFVQRWNQVFKHFPNILFDIAMYLGQWESIEWACNWDCIGSHVLKNQPIFNVQFWKTNIFDNLIQCVTSGTPNGRIVLLGIWVFQQFWLLVLMIVQDAVEWSIDAIVDIVHDAIDGPSFGIQTDTFRLNVTDQSEGRCDIVAPWFSNNLNRFIRKEVIDSLINVQSLKMNKIMRKGIRKS